MSLNKWLVEVQKRTESKSVTGKELEALYSKFYSVMVTKEVDYTDRFEAYEVCVFILNFLLSNDEMFKIKRRLDMLNCLYYGILNFKLYSNKTKINNFFIEYFDEYRELLDKREISMEEFKIVNSLKFEYKIFRKVQGLEGRKNDEISFEKLVEFDIHDKIIVPPHLDI
ncbi:hypothetical protein R5N98_03780 [Tenacibaculum maritimum]|uniref:hypothetical protein n=1 Tax=Tenacibaculum maritimum TaxID=107401 RepID=UPI0012E4D934|nr:hypothetical protein [Tenacibaculum maritimum]MCD9612158.1 hypothetical protein [Tenacibaculum maritimum]CAA0183710.1 hypothetical protein TM902_520036 [Tenacibaculum maritimum]CAA0248487.1 hypothetical protein TMFC_60105 [Tenacibaculum maritimum]